MINANRDLQKLKSMPIDPNRAKSGHHSDPPSLIQCPYNSLLVTNREIRLPLSKFSSPLFRKSSLSLLPRIPLILCFSHKWSRMNQFASPSDISSALSTILLSGTNALDSIFAHLPPPVPSATTEPYLGSAVYQRQSEMLRQFSSSQSLPRWSLPNYAGWPRKKMYRGVRQRHWGKWVAEVRLPQSRMRVWLGTYDSPELAAYAYDRASYKLRGEYARLNFPGLRDATIEDCPERFRVLRTAVDAKIQAICQRRRAKKLKREEIQQSESHSNADLSFGPSNDSPSSSSVTAEEEVGPEWSLAKIPSFDPELIWEVLAN